MTKEIEVKVGNRPYRLAVEDDQETRVKAIAATLDDFVAKMRMASPASIDRDRLLVLAGIMMADDFMTKKLSWETKEETLDKFHNSLAEKIENLINTI